MHDSPAAEPSIEHHDAYACAGCGASLEYAPGTNALECPYCGHRAEVETQTGTVREHDYEKLLAKARTAASEISTHHMQCEQCGARFNSEELSHKCQFCAAPLVVDDRNDAQISPEGVVPFALERSDARAALRAWIQGLWFAPNCLKKVSDAETMKSTYVPHWTFDAMTVSSYEGERGEHYYETKTYEVEKDGKTETRTRRVRRTRWYPTSGTVRREFDDVLVVGTTRLDTERLNGLAPWPLDDAVAYTHEYLAGHEALRYDVEPDQGLADAKRQMARTIKQDCLADIGGDDQRLSSVDTDYSDVTGKLLLLPVWTGCYVYRGQTWQVLVNGCTGEVHGERPYSAVKITIAVLCALLVVAAVVAGFVMVS
ncbi:hypothetical protein RIF23_00655 [Lipingzhangella sp. LS1_29]|uniref:Replication restart DNA helicase PriA n=1 Tax=Lipingzhangella rawalii TaxID=2055835 RepID=A0ABU2H0G7_9ACTN|nr:hypothetical protein [Lipingzhangella rawalii]MDS1268798.1 hypothetical protein [Lipingzhangella rawalii]